jgi:hypothetical protein
MCKILIVVNLIFTFGCAMGQDRMDHRSSNLFDLAVSASPGQFSTAASWVHMHRLGKKERLQLGYGVRLTSFVGANKFYTTAPAQYTSTRQDIATIFSETIDSNIDTITTATAITYCLNATFNAQYRIAPRWDIGLNIDIAGVSFGPPRKFNIISSSFDASQQPVEPGSPTQFNLLLTSDNDIGSLNSEFFVRFWATPKIGLRGGYTFLFSEYRTHQELSFDNGRIVNDRFRHKAGMALVAITFKPFN